LDAECGLSLIRRDGFAEGDEVSHEHFGCGVIRNVYDGGAFCEVEFWEAGLRSLKTEKLTKVEK
jgi:hypothetical protein